MVNSYFYLTVVTVVMKKKTELYQGHLGHPPDYEGPIGRRDTPLKGDIKPLSLFEKIKFWFNQLFGRG